MEDEKCGVSDLVSIGYTIYCYTMMYLNYDDVPIIIDHFVALTLSCLSHYM